MDNQEAKVVLETALICSQEPLDMGKLRQLFLGEVSDQEMLSYLQALQEDWLSSGLELVQLSSGWRFQSKQEMHVFLERLSSEKPPRYSRAVLETLAIIAYRQPVTRGDIEAVRGVSVGTQIIRQLEERGWVEVIGQRDVPGRPALFATTQQFLDDLCLTSLSDLPAFEQTVFSAGEVLNALEGWMAENENKSNLLQDEKNITSMSSLPKEENTAIPHSLDGELTEVQLRSID